MQGRSGPRARSAVAAVAAAAVLLIAAANASAAPGDLILESCVADAGASGCADPPADALDAVRGVAVSPDGTSVYVTSNLDHAISAFDRAPNGTLTFDSCIAEPTIPGCTTIGATGVLAFAWGVAVSPDGTSVYVTSNANHAVNVFDRAPGGGLTIDSCVSNDGLFGCTNPPPADDPLEGALEVAVSPNGASVYATSGVDRTVTAFDRAAGGGLTFDSCVGEAGASGCADPAIDALLNPRGIAVSPDNASVYVTGNADDAINSFDRAAGGGLTFDSCVGQMGSQGCADPALDSLDAPVGVAVTPDGDSVYVASNISQAITSFDRLAGGALSQDSCLAEPGFSSPCALPPISGLGGANGVAVGPDNGSVYVTGSGDNAISAFDRSAGGGLAFDSCVADAGGSGCADPALDPLGSAGPVAVSLDGASVYVGSGGDDSVTHLIREPAPPAPGDGGGGDGADTDAPDTQITQKPKDKTKKKRATFAFSASEPATFACVLDGREQFKPCTSPITVKVKKGKHNFSVTATDATGNADPSPAVDSWKVKKKKKKR